MPTRLISSSSRVAVVRAEAYVCPSCVLKAVNTRSYLDSTRERRDASGTTSFRRDLKCNVRTAPSTAARSLRLPLSTLKTRQYATVGSLASVTAINAPSTVPPEYRDLHQKLSLLQESASSHVDIARLQLAIRSLESEHPVVRVALLGLGGNGGHAARKLARALLSDALSDEQPWEQEILQSVETGKSLLLRYGDSEDVAQHSPLIQTMHIPSRFLQRNNLELLVTSLNTNGPPIGESDLEEAILVPTLTAPNSSGGRVGFVRYPVHKALIVAEGVTGAIEYGRLPRFLDRAFLINSALSIPLRSSVAATTSGEEVATTNAVDVDLALHALDVFRTSKANGAQFSNEWQTSRLAKVTSWITGSGSQGAGINNSVRKLLDSVFLNASSSIEHAESNQASHILASTIPESKREALNTAIASWSAEAHRDLQVNLGTALESRTWRRTASWRLFWRIDDVSVSASDILRLSWLTEAEQLLANMSGRIQGTGLATADELKEAGASSQAVREEIAEEVQKWEPKRAQIMVTPAALLPTPTLLARVQQQSGIHAVFDPPWPQTIHLSRQQMLQTIVPSLHRQAQALLLSTLSTSGGTAALGGWLYLASNGTMLYEAGAIAALGLVWSLRRLQKLWSKERDLFTGVLREDGRRVLAEVEGHLRKIVREGGRVPIRPEDQQGWDRARQAVDTCREALEKIK